jgi:hypothetical protein
LGAEQRIKELDAWMDYLEIVDFLRQGLRDLLTSGCEVTLLGSHSASRKMNAIRKVRQAAWMTDGLEDRSGERVDVIDALYHARSDKFLPLYQHGHEFARTRRHDGGPQLRAPGAGLTLRLWNERPSSLSVLVDGGAHFNLTKKFGWVLFVPENQREALLSPA